MNSKMKMAGMAATSVLAGILILAAALRAGAHCDTMDGPVVRDAQAALRGRGQWGQMITGDRHDRCSKNITWECHGN